MSYWLTKRLIWLQARGYNERAEWTSRFRESTLTLWVMIIKKVFQILIGFHLWVVNLQGHLQ